MTRHIQSANSNNCVQVCLASIFDVPVDEPPHVFANGGEWTRGRWKKLARWCKTQGYKAYWLDGNQGRTVEQSGSYYVGVFNVAGMTERHAVVMLSGEVVHDPANAAIYGRPVGYIGFEKKTGWGCFWFVVIVGIACLLLFGRS